jgi:hypothetical protein
MKEFYNKVAILFFLFFSIKTFSQQIILSNKATVSLLTCDQGNQLHSLFGHTAIRINDPEVGFDAVYNFGYFDFNTPNFYLKFVKGDMKYFVAVDSFENFMAEYKYYQRGVYEQVLSISVLEKQQIFQKLNLILQSDDRFYTYKFIDRNCTTMVVDLLKSTIKINFTTKIEGQGKTYREILYGYLVDHFYEKLGINIIFGAKVDSKFNKIFLPLQLLESIKKCKTSDNLNLCADTKKLNKQSVIGDFSIWNNIFTLILFLSFICWQNNQKIKNAYFVIVGLLGLFLAGVGFYSFHSEVSMNYNVILFNPFLVLIPFVNNLKTLKFLILFIAALIFMYLIYVLNKPFVAIVAPLIITNIFLLTQKFRSLKTA